MVLLSIFIFFVTVFCIPSLCENGVSFNEKKCPVNCDSATEWCSEVFGKGGNISSGECEDLAFECTCNDVSGIIVNSTNGVCTWDGSFNKADPNGAYCFPHTALCPKDCSEIEPWTVNCYSDSQCFDEKDGFSFNCTTCAGQTFSIVGDATSCRQEYSSDKPECDPVTTCSGHGCCRKPGKAPDTSVCVCFDNSVQGHWTGPSCDTCDPAYDPGKGECTRPRPVIQTILSSIGSTWTMVLPNMAVLFLFVVFGLFRGEFESDSSFKSTALRKTGLSTVQVARRHQRGLFHSKYIPKRPTQSRCFVNNCETQPPQRGPPAY